MIVCELSARAGCKVVCESQQPIAQCDLGLHKVDCRRREGWPESHLPCERRQSRDLAVPCEGFEAFAKYRLDEIVAGESRHELQSPGPVLFANAPFDRFVNLGSGVRPFGELL
jgi:hypothetical protein